jgi:hypothetical protein
VRICGMNELIRALVVHSDARPFIAGHWSVE